MPNFWVFRGKNIEFSVFLALSLNAGAKKACSKLSISPLTHPYITHTSFFRKSTSSILQKFEICWLLNPRSLFMYRRRSVDALLVAKPKESAKSKVAEPRAYCTTKTRHIPKWPHFHSGSAELYRLVIRLVVYWLRVESRRKFALSDLIKLIKILKKQVDSVK